MNNSNTPETCPVLKEPVIGVTGVLTILEVNDPDYWKRSAAMRGTLSISNDDTTCEGQGFSGDAIDLYAHITNTSRSVAITEVNRILICLTSSDLAELAPHPLPPALVLDPTQPFPTDALLSPIREMVEELSDLHDAPSELVSLIALGAVSATLGKAHSMPTVRGLAVSGNLFTAAGVPSGVGKSVLSAPLFRPLHDYQRELLDSYGKTKAAKQSALAAVTSKLNEAVANADGGDAPEKQEEAIRQLSAKKEALEAALIPPRFLLEDATTEAMTDWLSKNGEFLASISADAKSVLANLAGRHRSGSKEDDIYLKAYSGDPFYQDRVGRGSVSLKNPRMVTMWLTQPRFFRGAFGDQALEESGFACRFIAICVAATEGDDHDGTVTAAVEDAYQDRLRLLAAAYLLHRGKPHVIAVSPDAADAMRQFGRSVKRYIRSGHLPVELTPYPRRWAENAYRLELVLHAIRHGDQSHLNPVCKDTANCAIRLMTWFAAHQVQLLDEYAAGKMDEKLNIALKFVNASPAGVTARDLRRHNAKFNDTDDAHATLATLVREGRIRSYRGHKSEVFERLRAPGGRP